MRYFLFNNASPAASYGIGTHLRHLVSMLERVGGIEIVFVDLNCNEKVICDNFRDNDGHWHLQMPLIMNGIEDGVYNRSVYNHVVRWNESKERDVLVFHFHYDQHAPMAALLKAKYTESLVLYTVHYQAWAFQLKGNVRRLKEILEMDEFCDLSAEQAHEMQVVRQTVSKEKEMLAIADNVIVLSKFTYDVLERCYGLDMKRIHLIYNAIADEMDSEQTVLGGSEESLNILYVGRLDLDKGLGFLISAFEIVHKKNPNSRLVIAGNGNYDACLPLVGDAWPWVCWLGRVDGHRLQQLYQKSAVGVLPSLNEQCSYTIIEMLKHSLPVVGTDCSGVKEMLEHAPHLRVAVDQMRNDRDEIVRRLGETIVTLLSDSEQLMAERRNARNAYLQRYSLSVILPKWKQLLEQSTRRISRNDDLLKMIDAKMFAIINSRADYMDLSFFGLSGLGLYLWWRMSVVADECWRMQIGEYLIYALDWIYEEAVQEMQYGMACDSALMELTCLLERDRFYPTLIEKLLPLCGRSSCFSVTEDELVANALKIYNYR